MELIKSFVINLVTTLVFMTAIELIAPENNMKKYIKFVLGLILVAILLNPIIEFASKGEKTINDAVSDCEKELQVSSKKYTSEKEKESLTKSFKDNFNKNCEKILSDKYTDIKFESTLDGEVDFDSMKFNIKSLRVGIKDKNVKKVPKIVIDNNAAEPCDDEKQKEIKEFLSREIGIDKGKITVYYM